MQNLIEQVRAYGPAAVLADAAEYAADGEHEIAARLRAAVAAVEG